MSYRKQRNIPLGGRYRQVSLYFRGNSISMSLKIQSDIRSDTHTSLSRVNYRCLSLKWPRYIESITNLWDCVGVCVSLLLNVPFHCSSSQKNILATNVYLSMCHFLMNKCTFLNKMNFRLFEWLPLWCLMPFINSHTLCVRWSTFCQSYSKRVGL